MKPSTTNWDGIRRLLRDTFLEEPIDDLEKSSVVCDLKKAFLTMNLRQISVVIERYGLHGGRDHTLSEIGEFMGRSGENVRQYEVKALRKLRHPCTQMRKYVVGG